jgi:hypothetical protein
MREIMAIVQTSMEVSPEEMTNTIGEIAKLWKEGSLVVYLGPDLFVDPPGFPTSEPELCARLCEKITVPGRLKGKLHESAQYIESYKHRKTLTSLMGELFSKDADEALVHRILSEYPLPLVVDTWFSTISSKSLVRPGEIQISAVSKAEYRDKWYRIDRKTSDGWEPADHVAPSDHVLYRPFGTMIPNVEVLVSDADFVEVLTEIDIQTPIPEWVKTHRTGKHFLFLGCHFDDQTTRMFARQIMKRSSSRHFVVTDGAVLPKEGRFYEQEGISILPLALNSTFLPKLKEELGKD